MASNAKAQETVQMVGSGIAVGVKAIGVALWGTVVFCAVFASCVFSTGSAILRILGGRR